MALHNVLGRQNPSHSWAVIHILPHAYVFTLSHYEFVIENFLTYSGI